MAMMYKKGGDIHRAVKEKSMHHTRHARKRGGATGDEASEVNDKEYGGGDKNDEPDAEVSYSGKSPVTDEAHGDEKKRGGKVKRKTGGKAEMKKEMGKVEGEERRHRMDRPGRKRGGGVGADKTPLTTASATKDRRGPSPGDDARGITGES
jgi:hypothetical protein